VNPRGQERTVALQFGPLEINNYAEKRKGNEMPAGGVRRRRKRRGCPKSPGEK